MYIKVQHFPKYYGILILILTVYYTLQEKMLPAHISHLERVIYVQLGIPSFKYLNLLIQKTIECIGNEDCQRHVVVRHEKNKIYFVKNNKDQNWYRAKMIKSLSATEIQVFLIDVGSTTETSRENVIDLEKVHSILTKYPAQVSYFFNSIR